MNWLSLLFGITKALPFAVQAVEEIHGGAPGTTKKQKALAILSDGLQGAAAADPALVPVLTAAVPAIGAAIDAVVAVLNAAKAHGAAPPPAQPVAYQ